MPNPFLVSDLDSLSIDRLLQKVDEYKRVIEAMSRFQNPTIARVVQNVDAAQAEIVAEIERRRE